MIEKTKIEDIDKIMEIYRIGKDIQVKSGNPDQWLDGYPKRELIAEDIQNGCSYTVRHDGDIVGVFMYFIGEEPTYKKIDGSWLDDEEYGVIHRIASCGKGVFSECVKWCLDKHYNLRIDTHRDNKIMQHLIIKNGFSYCGIIWVDDGSERLAYQLNLRNKKNFKNRKECFNMNIMQKAHELGEMIKESEQMKVMNEAEEAQKNDAVSEELLKEFNLKRMNLARDLQAGKIEQAEAIVKNNEAFAEMVKKSETIKNYVEAKKNFDDMVQEVNKILNFYITGQDPNCTHDCSTCGGCH